MKGSDVGMKLFVDFIFGIKLCLDMVFSMKLEKDKVGMFYNFIFLIFLVIFYFVIVYNRFYCLL